MRCSMPIRIIAKRTVCLAHHRAWICRKAFAAWQPGPNAWVPDKARSSLALRSRKSFRKAGLFKNHNPLKPKHVNGEMAVAQKIRILEGIRQGKIGGGESYLLSLVENLDRTRF